MSLRSWLIMWSAIGVAFALIGWQRERILAQHTVNAAVRQRLLPTPASYAYDETRLGEAPVRGPLDEAFRSDIVLAVQLRGLQVLSIAILLLAAWATWVWLRPIRLAQ